MSDQEDPTGSVFRQRLKQQTKAAGLSLANAQLDNLTNYYLLLRRWNRTINLTALPLANPSDQSINRLVIEPLQACAFIDDASLNWFDLASGGGSPAIPLKIAKPSLRLTMVESRSRKAAFLREAAHFIGLTGTTVLTSRVEDLIDSGNAAGSADLVTIRALKLESVILRVVSALLRPEGRLLLFCSAAQMEPHTTGFAAVAQAPLFGSNSTLQVFRKTG